MSRLLTITIEVHKQASKLASSPHYLHYKHLSYTLYSVPPHDVLIGLGSDHLHKLLYSLDGATRSFSLPSMHQTDGDQVSCMIVYFLIFERIC